LLWEECVKEDNDRQVIITRDFEAPAEAVFAAWTDPDQVKEWWGPADWSLPVCEIDLRPGGIWLYAMRGPQGDQSWGKATYHEIQAPNRLVYTDTFIDSEGNHLPGTPKMHVMVSFEDLGGRTRLTMTTVFETPEERQQVLDLGAMQGWSETLDRLAQHLAAVYAPRIRLQITRSCLMPSEDLFTHVLSLPTDLEIVMTREFDAPRELIFRAYTEPELIPKWWGPSIYTTSVDTMDVRPGGAWRFVQHGAEGQVFAFHGEYREVVPPERLVSTFEFEGEPGQVVIDELSLEDLGGRTRLTMRSTFKSRDDRDGMLEAGMESGAGESLNRLAGLVADLEAAD
jgi:uncharacterized protein YndB with AHSA1/START domain